MSVRRSAPNEVRRLLVLALEPVEQRAAAGDLAGARARVLALRILVDGCGTAPDPVDWIVECESQTRIRGYLDRIALNLGA